MSVDTVNYALSKLSRWIRDHPGNFSESGQRKLLAICDVMRGHLMADNPAGFNAYINDILAREPDAADFLLEELFGYLSIDDREGLDAKLAEV